MENYDIKIKRVENGFIVEYPSPNEDKQTESVFEYDCDDIKSEKEVIVSMLWQALEGLGIYNNKHEKYRINIEVEENK